MNKATYELKKRIRKKLRLDYILPEDIPDIDLYMDQVTTFMDDKLKANRRREDEKTLTKTMINNYTKNRLIPPPRKKKYGRDHLILLIYIYYLKNVVSIGDVKKILGPAVEELEREDAETEKTEKKNGGKKPDKESKLYHGMSLYEIYQATYEMEKMQYFNIESGVVRAAEITAKKFPEDKDPYLNKLAFIYLLGYDIFSKKRLIEQLIDELPDDPAGTEMKNPEQEK